jgi:hypothetical protein
MRKMCKKYDFQMRILSVNVSYLSFTGSNQAEKLENWHHQLISNYFFLPKIPETIYQWFCINPFSAFFFCKELIQKKKKPSYKFVENCMVCRKSQAKKVVCIPAPAAANSRPTGEVVPSDLWAWRKYGQKPIKGSPYPR